MKELPKVYDPKQVEKKIYDMWMQGGYFTPDPDPKKKPFSIVMPPPNVTGQLHMGHALDATLQDVLTRYKRMQGYAALWLPGYDHAGIATQIKVEENLRVEEGLTRYDLGREQFLDRVWAWKNKYGDRIVEQQKTLGASSDWTRSRFTMDDGCSRAVRETFCELYEKGLIYKGNRIINWCPHCRTALSDAEVEYQDMPGHFWYVRYPIEDSDEELIIATTRPETMLGDSGVAVHPDDERYTHLVGKNAILPLVGRRLPIVADDYVELGFGTGAVKMTPCHDPNDYEVGLRHNLEQILIMDEDAHIINGGKYNGLDRDEARRAIVADLEAEGYLVKVEAHNHNVGTCYRCGSVVEPLTSPQWFVKMKPLAEPAIECVRDGRIRFVPERFSKIYYNWMENVHDWCISRQLWWGHQIPAWYCDDCGEVAASRTDLTECPKCGSKHIHQDEDALDTWFSSGLWPFSTFGWPDKTEELEQWYPTSVLVTGYDIIFFWVARMITMGEEFMGKEPFKHVFIHGLVRDEQGRKMSKSLGNGIDPLEVVNKYGADTLRFMLITGNTPGNDMRFYWNRIESTRNFANKIWNASRFALMNLDGYDKDAEKAPLTLADKWILSRLQHTIQDVSSYLEKFELGEAGRLIYDFIWGEVCDWYIELAKPRLYDRENAAARATAQTVLCRVLGDAMKLLHPYMPFITEEIWQHLPHEGQSIMIAPWPVADGNLIDDTVEKQMTAVMDVIKAIRNMRAEVNAAPGHKAPATVLVEEELKAVFAANGDYIRQLGTVDALTLGGMEDAAPENAMAAVVNGAKVYLPLKGLIDVEKELARLQKELDGAEKEAKRAAGKLSNQNFLAKAPAEVVEKEKTKQTEILARIAGLKERITTLRSL